MSIYTVTASARATSGPFTLQSAATTGNGNAIQTNGKAKETWFIVEFSSGVTAGEVAIEAAATPEYTGDWATLATIGFVDGGTYLVQRPGGGMAYRARISTTISGGTVKVYAGCVL